MVPEGIDGASVISIAFRRHNLALGAGLARMAGKLFRIGHMGDLNDLMVLGALSGAEMAMADAGIKVEFGSGPGAAAAYYQRHPAKGEVERRPRVVVTRRLPKRSRMSWSGYSTPS